MRKFQLEMHKQRGFSLIELMISIAIGLMITAAVLSIFVAMLRSDNDNIKSIRLNQDLRATMGLIVRDLRRSGANVYSADYAETTPLTNPFQMLVIDVNEQAEADKCITFSYDENGDGVVAESFGYRFDSDNNGVETRKDGAACTAGGWEALTDNSLVTINNLAFSDETIAEGIVNIRQITVTLSGQLANDATVSRTLVETVKIRNDEV